MCAAPAFPTLTVRKIPVAVPSSSPFSLAWESFLQDTKEANTQARQLFEHALALDPQYAEAYAALSFTI
jgi:hypothetical protein